MESDQVPKQQRSVKSQQLTNEERTGILQYLLQQKIGNKLSRGAINETAAKFDVSRLTVSKIWNSAKAQFQSGAICADVSSKKRETAVENARTTHKNLTTYVISQSIPVERFVA